MVSNMKSKFQSAFELLSFEARFDAHVLHLEFNNVVGHIKEVRVAAALAIGLFTALEVPHVTHEIIDGHNNPAHTERRIEYRRYIEKGVEYAVSKNIKASGYLQSEHDDDIVHSDELSVAKRFPMLDMKYPHLV